MPRPDHLYRKLLTEIQKQIETGFSPGEPLPSNREWAQMYGVGQNTIQRVLRRLSEKGFVRVVARARCIRSGRATATRKPGPARRSLRVGFISRHSRNEWDTASVPYPALLEEARRRGMTVVEVPHRLALRPTPGRNRIELARVPWNLFDIGLLLDVMDHTTLSHPLLQQRPVAAFDQDATAYGIDSICLDDFESGFRLGEMLFELGHRSFAVCEESGLPGWPWDLAWVRRRHGFETALARLGGCVQPQWRVWGIALSRQRRRHLLREAAAKWAAAPADVRPTALLTQDASILDLIVEELPRAGLTIPRHMSVVTFTWNPSQPWPAGLRFTHIQANLQALIHHTFDALSEIAGGNMVARSRREARLYRVPSLLVRGESTAVRSLHN